MKWVKDFLVTEAVADLLQNRCSSKFRKFYKKTLVLESLFNKVAGRQACNFIEKRLQRRCFSPMAASELCSGRYSYSFKNLRTMYTGMKNKYTFAICFAIQ